MFSSTMCSLSLAVPYPINDLMYVIVIVLLVSNLVLMLLKSQGCKVLMGEYCKYVLHFTACSYDSLSTYVLSGGDST